MHNARREMLKRAMAVLAAAGALALGQAPCLADAAASASVTIHQGSQVSAMDLHFVVHLADWDGDGVWEGEGDETYYYITGWTISTSAGGTMSISQRLNPNTNNTYALDVDVTGIDVPYCTTVTINVSLTLNSWNSVVIDDVEFTYPSVEPGAPGAGFAFDPTGVPHGPHTTDFVLYNTDDDPDHWFRVEWLEFYVRSAWYDPEEQWSEFAGGPGSGFQSLTGPITLAPGEQLFVELSVPDSGGPSSFLYVAGEFFYELPGWDPFLAGLRFGHEEDMPVAADESSWSEIKALYE